KFTTAGTPPRPTGRTESRGTSRGALDTIGAGVNSPAIIRPQRNATTAARPTLRIVKRFDISSPLHYKRLELVLRERGHAEFPRLLELRPSVRTDDEIAGFSADRAGDFSAEPLDGGGGFLSRHRDERTSEHEALPGERSPRGHIDRRLLALHVHTGRLEFANEVLVMRLVRERPHPSRHHRPHRRHRRQPG